MTSSFRLSAATVLAGIISIATSARADDIVQIRVPDQVRVPETLHVVEPYFGQKNQLVLGGSSSFNISGARSSLNGQSSNGFAVGLDPLIGGFVTEHLLLGATLPIGYNLTDSKNWSTSIGVGPFIGAKVPLRHKLALLPRFGALYEYMRMHSAEKTGTVTPTNEDVDGHQIQLALSVDAVIDLAPHFSLMVGPYVKQSVYNQQAGQEGPWNTVYGVNVGILGWL